MKNLWKKPPEAPKPSANDPLDERRVGRIVHDERGTAVVEWVEAPPDYERPTLSIADTGSARKLNGGQTPAAGIGANPYERTPSSRGTGGGTTIRRDLRKLSEWIKLMRELEEQKRREAQENEEHKDK